MEVNKPSYWCTVQATTGVLAELWRSETRTSEIYGRWWAVFWKLDKPQLDFNLQVDGTMSTHEPFGLTNNPWGDVVSLYDPGRAICVICAIDWRSIEHVHAGISQMVAFLTQGGRTGDYINAELSSQWYGTSCRHSLLETVGSGARVRHSQSRDRSDQGLCLAQPDSRLVSSRVGRGVVVGKDVYRIHVVSLGNVEGWAVWLNERPLRKCDRSYLSVLMCDVGVMWVLSLKMVGIRV
jgi:hypothetical protein